MPEPRPTSLSARSLLQLHRWPVLAVTAMSLVGGLLEALFLVAVARTAFAITEGDDQIGLIAGRSAPMTPTIIIMLAVVLVRMGFALGTAWQAARLGTTVIADLRARLGRAFLRSTWTTQHGERPGHLQELLTTYSQQAAGLVDSSILAISAGFSLLALLLSAFLIDPIASLVVIGLVVALASVLRPIRAAVRQQGRATADTGMEFATSLSEVSQLGMEMHVFNVQTQTERRLTTLIADDAAATRRLAFLRGSVPVIYSGLLYLALAAGLGVVASLDTANITSVGGVMLIMLRSISYGQIVQTSSASINARLPFLDSLDQELDRFETARLVDHGKPVENVGRIALADVSFEYTSDVPVLRSIELVLEEREVVGIVGPSGSGKSTLVQLLLGLREPTSGSVLADGRDIREFSRSEWARKVTFVPQQAHLIAGTVAENIRFFREGITQEMIDQAARLANLHEDVEKFADGYQRHVGEQGSHLSGGQQQRLIIARALVEDPDLLILDEPTSSLDVRSEHLIRQTLDNLRERMTVVIIAHRLSTLNICDRIMVIQDGALKGFDTPENLEKTNDFYREALILSGMR